MISALRALLVPMSCLTAVAGCSSPRDGTGDLAIQLFLPEQVTLGSITYRISDPGAAPIEQSAALTGAPTTSFAFFAGLPAGPGYEILVTAESVDGLTTCRSSAQAEVLPNRTTQVLIPLQCSKSRGTAVVTASFECAQISALVAAPLATSVGGHLDLAAEVGDADGGATTFSWTASSGTLAAPAAGSTVFTCTAPGPVTIALTTSDGQCSDQIAVTVACVARSP